MGDFTLSRLLELKIRGMVLQKAGMIRVTFPVESFAGNAGKATQGAQGGPGSGKGAPRGR